MAEVIKVLRREKFAWPDQEIEKASGEISVFINYVQPTETLHTIADDPSDNRILECASAGKADFIVSGDDRLLSLKQFGNAQIVKVAEFLEQR
jgi:putative PIN family toxin of toxin-antitoxin system